MNQVSNHVIRLKPDQDLKISIMKWAEELDLHAATVISCTGSLKSAKLRLANATNHIDISGPFEICSLTGTFSIHGGHFHIALADSAGNMIGGHLLDGSLIHTTAEISIIENSDLDFLRTLDPQTGYKELSIIRRE